MNTTSVHVFDREVALPAGWRDETVHVFAGPSSAGGKPVRGRATMSVSRVAAKDLDAAIAALGGPGELEHLTVIADDVKQEGGVVYYERVHRFAEPSTGTPIQASTRVYHQGELATIVVFTSPAIAFNDGYGAYARFADAVARAPAGSSA